MGRFPRLLALVLFGAAGTTGGLVAQVRGLPVRNAGIGTGLGLAADIGFPNGDAGKGVALGATGQIGLGPLGVSASVATWDPSGSARRFSSAGATGNLKIFGGPLIPISVTLQGGAAYSNESSQGIEGTVTAKTWHVPVGLGLALTIPNPIFSIKPWVAPRLDVTRTRITDPISTSPVTNTDTHFGLSAGIDLGFINGFSLRAMYDRVQAGSSHPSIVSVGAGYGIRLHL
jgi:outer membrane protein with beta-barrel domain